MSLNMWLQTVWAESWPEITPAPELFRTGLWHTLSGEIPPPHPFERDLELCALLDENYGAMIRHGLNPAAGVSSTPLVEWRREISRAFRKRLRKNGYFHPTELPVYISQAMEAGNVTCPGGIYLSGFESPAPIEAEFFSFLERKTSVEYRWPQKTSAEVKAIALPSPEAEIQYLIHCLAEDARSLPLHRIGVIVPDLRARASTLDEGLKDVLGENPSHASQWFNITLGKPLHASPLVKAALLPLRFVTEREPRNIFLSLLLSPYYGCWRGHRQAIARADRIWRQHSLESGLDRMIASLSKEGSTLIEKILADGTQPFLTFCKRGPGKTGNTAFLIKEMTELWTALRFPVISDEMDTIAWKHLQNILHDMDRDLSKKRMNVRDFLSWTDHDLSRHVTQTGASEEAGIQIMGLIESRGLAFDKVYILDMNDRSFPQPVRPLPFLDRSERREVQGGTAQSQYDFAERAIRGILASTSSVTLLRAEQEDATPLTPSPFWPESTMQASIDIWRDPGPAWLRAPWLGSSFTGLDESKGREKITALAQRIAREDIPPDANITPRTLSPSDMERALTCPYMFFVSRLLGIEELEETYRGIAPRERGIRLHRILAAFTKGARASGPDLFTDRKKVLKLLVRCVDEELRDVAEEPHWQVERARLLDRNTSTAPGLLIAWLDEEIRHRQDGWTCVAEEADFADLSDPGWPFSLRGRIDRIDYTEDRGIVCWDYKTGDIPTADAVVSQYIAPQLPLYLLAIKRGKVAKIRKYLMAGTTLCAGYIQVKSLKAVKISLIESIEPTLGAWNGVISDLGEIFKRGDFPAEPFPLSSYKKRDAVCSKCPFITVCEQGVKPVEMINV
jgi:RecB family exonuclease